MSLRSCGTVDLLVELSLESLLVDNSPQLIIFDLLELSWSQILDKLVIVEFYLFSRFRSLSEHEFAFGDLQRYSPLDSFLLFGIVGGLLLIIALLHHLSLGVVEDDIFSEMFAQGKGRVPLLDEVFPRQVS